MTYLIDTDVLVDFFKHKEPAKGLIEKLSSNSTLALSPLTITELRSGWTSEQADFLLPRLYALCAVVPVTKEIAEQAGKWRQEYKSKGVCPTFYTRDSSIIWGPFSIKSAMSRERYLIAW